MERSGPRRLRYSACCEIAAIPSEHVRLAVTRTRTEGFQPRSAKTFLSRNFLQRCIQREILDRGVKV
jgi:hypothetical protein